MIDADRINELRQEIGPDDLAMVIGMFLGEARGKIDSIATGLPDGEHARAIHFLRSGALNIGLVGFAQAADLAGAAAPDTRAGTADHLVDILGQSVDELGLDIPEV